MNKAIFVGAILLVAGLAGVNFSKGTQQEITFLFENARIVTPNIIELGTSYATPILNNQGNVLVTPNSPEEDMLPSITVDGNGNIVVTWTHEISAMESDVGIAFSTDGGNSFQANVFQLDGYQYYADSAYVEGSKYSSPIVFDGIWGICLEQVYETGNVWLITDVTNPDTYQFISFTEGILPGATYACIEDDSWYWEHTFDMTGPVHFYIDDDQGMDDGWMLFWMHADISSLVYNWDAESVLDTAPAQDPDMACIHDSDPAWSEDDFFYTVAQHINESTGRLEVTYKRCVPVEEDDIEFVAEQFYLAKGDTYDAAHPEVDAQGDKVVVVYMCNDNPFGDWDIKCAYSNDRGQTWGTSTVVEEHPADEMYPSVYMSGNSVYVVYVKDGNLYLVKSTDGGATWGEPKQINDVDGTVVAEENAVEIDAGGIVWTDTRNGNRDIYYAPLPAPLITIDVSGGFGVKATISNTGSEAAENVDWSIDLSGLVFLGKHAEGTIPSLAPGESTTVSPGFVLGIGPTTVTVTAGGATKTASGFVLGPLVLGLS